MESFWRGLWRIQWRGGGAPDPISFIFMQFPAKVLPNYGFLPQTQRLAPRSGESWIGHWGGCEPFNLESVVTKVCVVQYNMNCHLVSQDKRGHNED